MQAVPLNNLWLRRLTSAVLDNSQLPTRQCLNLSQTQKQDLLRIYKVVVCTCVARPSGAMGGSHTIRNNSPQILQSSTCLIPFHTLQKHHVRPSQAPNQVPIPFSTNNCPERLPHSLDLSSGASAVQLKCSAAATGLVIYIASFDRKPFGCIMAV